MQNILLFFLLIIVCFLALVLTIVIYSYQKSLERYAHLLTNQFYHNYLKQLEEVADKELRLYDKNLTKIRENAEQELEKLSKHIEIDTSKQIEELISQTKEVVSQGTLGLQQIIQDGMKKELTQARTEIENYKKEQLQQVDQEIVGLTQKVAINVLGESITEEKQTDLVLKALNDAKAKQLL